MPVIAPNASPPGRRSDVKAVLAAELKRRRRAERPKANLSFTKFLRAFKDDDSPEGDFARDALADRKFPDVQTENELMAYLGLARNACVEAIDAGERLWRLYRRAVQFSGTPRRHT